MIVLWIGFFASVGVLLMLDLFVFHREKTAINLREAGRFTAGYVGLGVLFTVFVYFAYQEHWFGLSLSAQPGGDGARAAALYITAYVVELSLSIDNVFVIAVIMTSFEIPQAEQHDILFWGILGALVFRGLMLWGGVWLVQHFTWSFYVFGAFLAFTGLKMLRSEEGGHKPIEESRTVRLVRKVVPVAVGDYGGKFFVKERGRRAITKAFLALLVIEATDVLFAVDSVPAVLAVTTDSFIAISSNVLAILGLRSLYFVLAEIVHRFRYFKYALAILLVFIGAKMLLHSVIHLPIAVSLGVIVGVLAAGVLASLYADRREK